MRAGTVSIVVSVYNEEAVLHRFWEELKGVLEPSGIRREVIFVNDGSTDGSRAVLEGMAAGDASVRLIHLSRNFGHEAAMTAGIDHAGGDAVICMDADLQHPPSAIPEMLLAFEQGYDIVNMIRSPGSGCGFLKNFASTLFYRLLNRLAPFEFVPNASDFFLVSGRVAGILRRHFRERTRFLRGFIQIVGFRKTALRFTAPERPGGRSKYSLSALVGFSVLAVAIFSYLPLRLGALLGFVIALLSLAVGAYSVVMKVVGDPLPGYTTIVVLLSLISAIQLIIMSVIGEYVGLILDEGKKRPIYLVESMVNFPYTTPAQVEPGEVSEAGG